MQSIIKQIHKLLIKSGKTIAVAESCTGGELSANFTRLSGSSQYFILGLVAYSNKAKIKLLDIPKSLTNKKGAVSKEVAQRLAQNVKKIAKTDFGIGITGLAGPNGGSSTKPIGTVFVAIAAKNKLLCKKFQFRGSRSAIRKLSVLETIKLLKLFLH